MVAQMDNAMRLPISVAGALMPDAHVGYGLPIGGVLATDNAVRASRGLVFGLLAMICLFVAAPLGTILFVRFAQVVLSRMTRTDHATTVWLSYMITGGLMMLVGFIVLRLRHTKNTEDA